MLFPADVFLFTSRCAVKAAPLTQHSFTFLFAACTNCSSPIQGQMFHVHFISWGFEFGIYTLTALVDMYAKMGLLPSATRLFDAMEMKDVPTWNSLIAGFQIVSGNASRNVISWTTMISGCSQNGKYANALAIYTEMEKDKRGKVGEKIEAYARASGYFKNRFVCNALLEMYTKCGRIDRAMQLFHEIGKRRNLCSWNTMIMGLAVHGKGEGNTPDDVTFVGAILAFTHGVMVAKGWELLHFMEQRFSIAPKLEHYGCMVDLLGRDGKLQEVYDLVQSMPMRPDSVIWGTLLGACSFHGNVELAKKTAEFLSVLEPWNPGNYVILSNIYARAGSFIEEGGDIHKFIVEDKSHPKSNEICALLDLVTTRLKFDVSTIDIDLDSFVE
ncbi:unnamed protein product [Withania somnifera]